MIDNSKRYKFGPIGLIFFKFKTSTFAGSDLVSFFSSKIILHRVTNERERKDTLSLKIVKIRASLKIFKNFFCN